MSRPLYIPALLWYDDLNDERGVIMDNDRDNDYIDELRSDYCPEHRDYFKIVGEHTTKGSDPYIISHLACGHQVCSFGPGEENVVISTITTPRTRGRAH